MLGTLLAEAYVHALNPFAIRFSGDFGVRWYGVSYAAGFVIGWFMLRWFAKTGRTWLTVQGASDFILYIILGVLIGGRVGYVLFYHPSYFISFTDSLPFWDLLAINKGGMASHGGVIGVTIACVLYARKHRRSTLHLVDLMALCGPPGLFLGRLANFVNGELVGKALPSSMQTDPPWWSVKYPRLLHDLPADQLPLLTSAVEQVGVFPSQWANWLAHADNKQYAAQIHLAIDKVVQAAYDGNQQIVELIRPLLTAYYPSQLLQALTDGPILLLILCLVWLKPRQPGILGAAFLIGYGILRIATEVFRQADEGVAIVLGLQRGQLLSVLMILAGVALFIFARSRATKPVGGLLRIAPVENFETR